MEKLDAFLTWWHSIFGSWNPNKLPSLSFWFLEDDLMQHIPMIASWLLLGVVISSILTIIFSVFTYKNGKFLIKLVSIPLCFLGLITIRLANEMSHTLFMSAIPTFISIFTELIPGLFSQPNIGSFLLELFSIILAIPLSIFSILLHGGLTILGLAPFLIQIVIDIVVYKWTAPIHILADIGGGIILVLALALIVLGAGFVGAFMLFTVFFPFFGPIFVQSIREWNFTGGGGTIIRK